MKCDHGTTKKETYIPAFDCVGEVYMCECGALLNIADEPSGTVALDAERLQELVTKLKEKPWTSKKL
jgi:hypothetical protein